MISRNILRDVHLTVPVYDVFLLPGQVQHCFEYPSPAKKQKRDTQDTTGASQLDYSFNNEEVVSRRAAGERFHATTVNLCILMARMDGALSTIKSVNRARHALSALTGMPLGADGKATHTRPPAPGGRTRVSLEAVFSHIVSCWMWHGYNQRQACRHCAGQAAQWIFWFTRAAPYAAHCTLRHGCCASLPQLARAQALPE